MNFAYLLVEGCYGYGKDYEGLPKLKFSIDSLRKNFDDVQNIYLYYGYDELVQKDVDKIEKFCADNNVILKNFGKLKHQFAKSFRESSNPYQQSLLIEKMYMLKNHDKNEDICYVDLDTEFTPAMKNYKFDLNRPMFHKKEDILVNVRHLGDFFNKKKMRVPDTYRMYNSGIIFVPKRKRQEIGRIAVGLILRFNSDPDDRDRICNRLDDQIAISIAVQNAYKEINLMEDRVLHYWSSVIENNRYWEK